MLGEVVEVGGGESVEVVFPQDGDGDGDVGVAGVAGVGAGVGAAAGVAGEWCGVPVEGGCHVSTSCFGRGRRGRGMGCRSGG